MPLILRFVTRGDSYFGGSLVTRHTSLLALFDGRFEQTREPLVGYWRVWLASEVFPAELG